MKFFSKSESKAIIFILLVLFSITGLNMKTSVRKGRDNTRKNDMSVLQKGFDIFQRKYNMFPPSIDGKIGGCFESDVELDPITGKPVNLVICEWGKDSFENIPTLPRDPNFMKGTDYLYLSDTEKYQIYVSLEGEDEAEYSQMIVDKNLKCGNKICNSGREY